ncbi:cation-transporting P-type ATPase [Rhizobiales bacterium L72]|uniref:Cation-transporting P-type ATPase n=2 Tax=Propylenella binzhouense TaxID=2555902 RepID=A0A964WV91_9HYPH|nr:cation-transporting P-type ATPase [Propylenella binzhouense]MYZ49926.1 cation-transporting P-type ATPase [Propylenella binzhouense]
MPPGPIEDAHAREAADVLAALQSSVATGLNAAEAGRRLAAFGPNRLATARRKSRWAILREQFDGIIAYLLMAAAIASFLFEEWAEGIAIVAVLAINGAVGYFTELRAVRSMEALRRLSQVRARVRRDGATAIIAADAIVPGDIVFLESGDVVPADLRLLETANLQSDESALTGESVPVEKSAEPAPPGAGLGDRTAIAFKGTSVTRGSGIGVAVATGMATELGRIAALTESAEASVSPLEKRLDRLGGQLVRVTLALTVLIAAFGVYVGHGLLAMIETAIALAVAAVPEGLPIVATVALARGMWRMARRNALIENLSAVETLGATTIILTDKTGTLTENRMTVVRIALPGEDIDVAADADADGAAFSADGAAVEPAADEALRTALRIAVLCNAATLPAAGPGGRAGPASGDPMEVALLAAGRLAKLEQDDLLARLPKVREEAFSTATRMMATFHRSDNGLLVAVKGAPEEVVARATQVIAKGGLQALDERGRRDWTERQQAMARDGLRVIALAMRQARSETEEPYAGLTLVGLVGLIDPPRGDVAEAIAACREAGVRVVMLTGDHAVTARSIASEIGLADDDALAIDASQILDPEHRAGIERNRLLKAAIFARVSPEAKLDLVALHQAEGAVVAMTGDGVNDAPALKKADIGIAMGRRGTEVAREAADMVLSDDSFASIVAAMRQGRVIYANIRKFVVYLMSCNLSEILVIGIATVSGLPLPLLPLQILYLNLVTDVFPAFALGVGEGDPNVMRRPPRNPREPILDRRRWVLVGAYAGLIAVATLGAFVLALWQFGMTERDALTISFLTLASAQLWHVFNMRDRSAGLLRNEVTRNPWIWAALALCAGLVAAAVYAPGLSRLLGMSAPSLAGWLLVLGASLVPVLLGPLAYRLATLAGGTETRRA